MPTTTTDTTTNIPVANAVLVLSTANSSNKPMVVDFEGQLSSYNIDLCILSVKVM